jgi:hypothetical protein
MLVGQVAGSKNGRRENDGKRAAVDDLVSVRAGVSCGKEGARSFRIPGECVRFKPGSDIADSSHGTTPDTGIDERAGKRIGLNPKVASGGNKQPGRTTNGSGIVPGVNERRSCDECPGALGELEPKSKRVIEAVGIADLRGWIGCRSGKDEIRLIVWRRRGCGWGRCRRESFGRGFQHAEMRESVTASCNAGESPAEEIVA